MIRLALVVASALAVVWAAEHAPEELRPQVLLARALDQLTALEAPVAPEAGGAAAQEPRESPPSVPEAPPRVERELQRPPLLAEQAHPAHPTHERHPTHNRVEHADAIDPAPDTDPDLRAALTRDDAKRIRSRLDRVMGLAIGRRE